MSEWSSYPLRLEELLLMVMLETAVMGGGCGPEVADTLLTLAEAAAVLVRSLELRLVDPREGKASAEANDSTALPADPGPLLRRLAARDWACDWPLALPWREGKSHSPPIAPSLITL